MNSGYSDDIVICDDRLIEQLQALKQGNLKYI